LSRVYSKVEIENNDASAWGEFEDGDNLVTVEISTVENAGAAKIQVSNSGDFWVMLPGTNIEDGLEVTSISEPGIYVFPAASRYWRLNVSGLIQPEPVEPEEGQEPEEVIPDSITYAVRVGRGQL
jgi:hypothetical protein